MKGPDATVIDAGVGNLANLERALRFLGAAARVTDDPERVAAARCLLLPGVGAFRPPRDRLRDSGLEEALREALDGGAWLLGICVGFQLLFEAGEEFGETEGLGILSGRVTRLPEGVPLPHIGWNALHDVADHPLFYGNGSGGRVGEGSHVYFVHSYAVEGAPADQVLALATHGRAFPAVAGRGRVLGTQFHPEKSGPVGLSVLEGFLRLAGSPESAATPAEAPAPSVCEGGA